MYSITDIKKGTTIELSGEPYIVTEYTQKQMGRGGSIVSVKVKSLLDGHVESKTFKGNEKINPAELERKKAQYLYQDESLAHFMDQVNFEQFTLPLVSVADKLSYLPEGETVDTLLYGGRVIDIDLPIKTTLEVTYTEDVTKGDTQSTVLKDAQLETGINISVPIFIKTGDNVVVDTRDGTYVERQKG